MRPPHNALLYTCVNVCLCAYALFPIAGQQHLLPLIPQGRIMPGVVHRPQVKLNNNVVTLSNVQSPAVYSSSVPQPASNQPPKTEFIQVHPSTTVEGKGGMVGQEKVYILCFFSAVNLAKSMFFLFVTFFYSSKLTETGITGTASWGCKESQSGSRYVSISTITLRSCTGDSV